ncbi:unnamed protein product [Cylindrotheca closterium]|uniref:Uncharacterized protein n=1 Tax=Cylindrotheca closterium TaxID=2856 RepID=A0AAD2GDK9_9STRA|nr:unnamed protein product [Cylindrotheca closterium]
MRKDVSATMVDAQQKVYPFVPEFSSGFVTTSRSPCPQPNKKNRSTKTTPASPRTLSTKVSVQKKRRSIKKDQKCDPPPIRRSSLSWLASPAVSPHTPRSVTKSSGSRALSKRSLKHLPSAPLNVQDEIQKLQSSNRRGSLSWLASPAVSPHTPRSVTKRSGSRALSKRSLKHLPSAPLNVQDEIQKLQSSNHDHPLKTLTRDSQGGSTRTLFMTGSADSFGPSLDCSDRAMSHQFPMFTDTQKVVFRKQPKQRDIAIETNTGVTIGSIVFVNEGTLRLLKDASGKTCGMIRKTRDKSVGGGNLFQVYSNKPVMPGQKQSKNKIMTGCYLWAEIKNTGSMGGKFVMKRYSGETSSCSGGEHRAQPFGSLFSKDKTKGYTFLDGDGKECTKMISLKNRDKGIAIAPRRDTGLMLAFCAVVDEMVERRLR